MPPLVILDYQESSNPIGLFTSKNSFIQNSQQTAISEVEVNIAQSLEQKFNGKYIGNATAVYNCHGLTFAAKRTCITDKTEIDKILHDEYREIKNRNEVIPGDIVLYLQDGDYYHSGIVVKADSNDGIFTIWILSKIKYYREIVHCEQFSPYGNNRKYYRINHAIPAII